MTTFGDLINEVTLTLNGYGLAQPRAAFLASSVTADATSFQVTDASLFNQGVAEIGDEIVFVQTVDTDSNTLTIAPDGRGYYGTTAAAYDTNQRIESAPTWPRNRIKLAINDVIQGLYPTLFGVSSTSFTFDGSATTYEMPADAEGVLRVTCDTIGPSQDQPRLSKWAFNSVAPTSEFATGNSITLGEFPLPGRTVTVVYRKQPSTLSDLADNFTTTGLQVTAKPAVVLGACAHLLAFMDAARLPVDTSRADQYDDRNAVGIASRIAAQLTARFEMEVEKERQRLRASTPVPINMRIR